MLTVKVVNTDGSEDIFCGEQVSYLAHRHTIKVLGLENHICIQPGQIAYVMNSDGKTISKYDGVLPSRDKQVQAENGYSHISIHDQGGDVRAVMKTL